MADVFTSAPASESPASSPPTSDSTIISTTLTGITTYTTTTTNTPLTSSSGSSPTSPSSDTTTLITSTTPFDTASSPLPTITTTPNYWGWNCNTTNSSRGGLSASESGWACSETFVLPSSTKISMNLTEPSATGNESSEPTRTFVPGDFPGAASRPMDAGMGSVMGWAGLMVVVGVWVGLL
ncbi:hypothetical protein K458DRAFT_398990 [Lentithecium fluviatile CBS 122367]|uniref:Uncharacterized protein n=1 Tax=Lentithecium fluviatile CBS 122367 TaxID=1168545 RepID=A0A6G1JKV2_9PLEO|nr:hypothetical protein K458DRAFT_398990 [Lentithecium fluviatile CBS 122367]